MYGRVLSVAGSDCSGGAGIQADIKTITALGGYASTAITAITVQNTHGVTEVEPLDPFLVERQVEAVLTDIGADAIKLGMLATGTILELVTRKLQALASSVPIVLDPVFLSSSGNPLLEPKAVTLLRERLLPVCALATPNADEASLLSGVEITGEGGMHEAADQLLLAGANAVLITGGHVDTGDVVVDLLRTADGDGYRFEHPRLETRATHGTGCTLSSAIATGLAQGLTLHAAVTRARDFVYGAMQKAVPLGHGAHGPLNHCHMMLVDQS